MCKLSELLDLMEADEKVIAQVQQMEDAQERQRRAEAAAAENTRTMFAEVGELVGAIAAGSGSKQERRERIALLTGLASVRTHASGSLGVLDDHVFSKDVFGGRHDEPDDE